MSSWSIRKAQRLGWPLLIPRPLLLLVDDDPVILDLLDGALTDAGFDVVIAGRSAHALAEINTNVARFSAVIIDIKLDPLGSDGWEIVRRARELDPHIPVVYVSGSGLDEWPSKGVPKSVMIAKPFAVAQLITAVNLLLSDAERTMKERLQN
jgi:DNA-binding response OmpR family regulator